MTEGTENSVRSPVTTGAAIYLFRKTNLSVTCREAGKEPESTLPDPENW